MRACVAKGILEANSARRGFTCWAGGTPNLRLGDWPCTPAASQPYIQPDFCSDRPPGLDEDASSASCISCAKRAENEIREAGDETRTRFTFPRFLPNCRLQRIGAGFQLTNFYRELSDPDVRSALLSGLSAIFRTNIIPSMAAAHPYRLHFSASTARSIRARAVNRELGNSCGANRCWHRHCLVTFEKTLSHTTVRGKTDSARFDNALELLLQAGRSPSSARMAHVLIPEALGRKPTHEAGEAGRSMSITLA